MNVYLDIDGVLLANDLNPANHVHKFLQTINQKAEKVYWLTTHCQGDSLTAVKRLSLVFEPKTLELIKNYKPTTWETAKTRAIDIKEPFLWFDDNLFHEERITLEKHGLLDNWIEVNLTKYENHLLKFITDFPIPVQGL